MTNIHLATGLLKRNKLQAKDDRYLDIISTETNKLKNQISQVLSISRIENGEHRFNRQAIDLKNLLEQVTQEMRLHIEQYDGTVILNLPDVSPEVVGDPHHLGNVFRNLIDNAIKYSHHRPRVVISLQEMPDHLVISFNDNGIGISKQDQHHIFQKFQRVNTGDVRDANGFGLGLSYVKTVMQNHGGEVRLKSDKNVGSSFELIIPKCA